MNPRAAKPILVLLGVIAVFALVVASCGGGDDDETAAPGTPTADPTPTSSGDDGDGDASDDGDGADGADGADAGSADGSTSTPTPSGEPTADPDPEFVAPLTGLGVDEAVLSRPAVVAKIDNHEDARPQTGLNDADVVVEILVEGITRLAAVFHSSDVEVVGPVRSARTSDPDIVANFGMPLMAFSGANAGVLGVVAQAAAEGKLVDASWDRVVPAYFRQGPNAAPHNLYTNLVTLREARGAEAGTPPALFAFRETGAPGAGDPTAGVNIVWSGGLNVAYAWDDATGTWARFQRGVAHTAADGVQVAPDNVVILFTNYGFGGGSPQAISTGEGEAWVLTDGGIVRGTWTRPDASTPWQVVDSAGRPVELSPGTTWMALPQPGEAAELTPAEADALLASR